MWSEITWKRIYNINKINDINSSEKILIKKNGISLLYNVMLISAVQHYESEEIYLLAGKFLECPVHCRSPDKQHTFCTSIFEWVSDYWKQAFFAWWKKLHSEVPGVRLIGWQGPGPGFVLCWLGLMPGPWLPGASIQSPAMKGVNPNLPSRCSNLIPWFRILRAWPLTYFP